MKGLSTFKRGPVLASFDWDQLEEENAFHQHLDGGLEYTGLYQVIYKECVYYKECAYKLFCHNGDS